MMRPFALSGLSLILIVAGIFLAGFNIGLGLGQRHAPDCIS